MPPSSRHQIELSIDERAVLLALIQGAVVVLDLYARLFDAVAAELSKSWPDSVRRVRPLPWPAGVMGLPNGILNSSVGTASAVSPLSV
ncbi:hypothetical protein [Kibdelosporangium aridum]|uniref:hypothetical protein n=1 Tax=Kibdelosporangium aridum TaxID=2030 RepID=UPI0035E5E3D1